MFPINRIVPEVILLVHTGDKYMVNLLESELMTLHKAIREITARKN